MKFHGIAMVGPFVNQKYTELPVFEPSRDQGRLVWLAEGTFWYGSDTEWVNVSSGAGDANEVEDMYSDLLRTTIFLNASFDEFADNTVDDDLVESSNMTHDRKLKYYTYTAGQVITSANLFDSATGLTWVDYILPSVDFVEGGSPQIEVSSNGGVNWFVAENNKLFRIPTASASTDLRMRFTGAGVGTLNSWGILYNKDLTAACTKYGLTYANFVATEGQTLFEIQYMPGAIQVFLNGGLLDMTDFTATSGTDVVFSPALHDGDIVYIISYSTSILDPNVDFDDFIRHDGQVVYTANQPMGNFILTDLADGVNNNDSVNMGQLGQAVGNVDHTAYTLIDGTRPFTGPQSMGTNKLTSVLAGTLDLDAVNKGQFVNSANIQILPDDSFYAWGIHTNAADGQGGYTATIDPKSDIANIGTSVGAKTLSINNVQLTQEVLSLSNFAIENDYLHLKAGLTSGNSTFMIAALRTGVSVETDISIGWFCVGYLV